MLLFVNEARRKWITSYDRMKGFPVYISPAEMRRLCLQLLRQYASGKLPEGFFLRHVVLLVDHSGNHSLECFGSSDYMFDHMEYFEKKKCKTALSWEVKGLLELCLCLASQYCQNEVFDWQGQPIPWEERRVLNPDYLSGAIDRLERDCLLTVSQAEHLFETAPEELLVPGDWRLRSGVVRWQTKLNWWLKKDHDLATKPAVTPESAPSPSEKLLLNPAV